ncbi:MAG: DUF748 domain-containing protein [Symploca sp. SIO1C4]|uniref:DUF748 domain-containing protein n=1 Tax=Symploca sp. SIO1C4 TaxID=2607765 RepID=A0A6B3N779_9CYAN|nr:DUF748 domain-containing protein [Symploca sp. SIO1C4]
MTNSSPNTPPTPSSEPSQSRNTFLLRWLRHPYIIAVGIAALTLGAIGYVGSRIWIYQQLPPLLEKEVGKLLNREVRIGQVKGFSLNGIEFGSSSIPATPTDADYVSIETIKVGFNLLPLIWRRSLPLNIKLVKVKAYADQDQTGKWLNLDLEIPEGEPPPITVDTNIRIDKGEIALLPQGKSTPLAIQFDGKINSIVFDDNQPLKYDLRAAIANGKVKLKGQTLLETGKSKLITTVENLSLAPLSTLIPNSPLALNSGGLGANLDISLPSFQQMPSILGTLRLLDIEAQAEDLLAPVKAKALLRFQGQKLLIEETKASYGNIQTSLGGVANWEEGFNSAINLNVLSKENPGKTVPVISPVAVDTGMQVKVQIDGSLAEPVITGTINSTKVTRIDKLELAQIGASFSGDKQKFALNKLLVKPVAGGQITGNGRLDLENSTATATPLAFDFDTSLPVKAIAAPYYSLPAEITLDNITAQTSIRGTLQQPSALLKWQIPQASVSTLGAVSGAGEVVLNSLDTIVVRNTQMQIGKGTITAQGKLEAGVVEGSGTINQIQLAELGAPAPITLDSGEIKIAAKLNSLEPETIDASAQMQLAVEGGIVNATGKLNSGNLAIDAIASQIQLANLGTPINSQINGKAKLLTKIDNLDLQNMLAQADLQADLAQGTVNIIAQLDSGQWQSEITAAEINSSSLLTELKIIDLEDNLQASLPAVNAKLNLSGPVEPLVKSNPEAIVKADNISIQMGEQALGARGVILLSNKSDKNFPWDVSTELDLKAHYDSQALPLSFLISQLAQTQEYLEDFKVTGEVDLNGRLVGKNLLSAPLAPGNLNLSSKLNLEDFAINDIEFDPVLAGNFNIEAGKEIALNLRGKKDVIAAKAKPCQREGLQRNIGERGEGRRLDTPAPNCLLPYLPVSFELRQGEGSENPILVSGKRRGDIFNVSVQNFELAMLNIAPAVEFGIPEAVSGEVTGELGVNLFTLATTSNNIEIVQPTLGYIQAKKFEGRLSYDNGVAQLNSASLELGQSRYELEAGLDLDSNEVNGKLTIASGHLEDLTAILNQYSFQAPVREQQYFDNAGASAVQIQAIGSPQNSLAQQLNLLSKIQIRNPNSADTRQVAALPTQLNQLNLEGAYAGQITVAGSLEEPKIEFDLNGNNWQWRPTQDVVTTENSAEAAVAFSAAPGAIDINQAVSIDEVIAQGSIEQGMIKLEPVHVKLGDALLSLDGELSETKGSGAFKVEKLPLALVRNFVEIPVALQGNLNVSGDLGGSLTNPEIRAGEISFVDGRFNCQSSDAAVSEIKAVGDVETQGKQNDNYKIKCQHIEPIKGKFSYSDARLKFNTTEPSSIQLQATVPYPIQPKENDQLNVNLKLDTEAIALIEPFTQGQVELFQGGAEVELQTKGTLNLEAGLLDTLVNDLVANTTGLVTFQDTVFKSAVYPEPLHLNGKIALNNQRLEVVEEKLEGEFSESRFSVTGVLPLFEPLKVDATDLSNPLKVSIEPGKLNLEGLYKGEIDAEVVITGAALSPVISGEIKLQNGRVFVPEGNTDNGATLLAATGNNSSSAAPNSDFAVIPKFDNFRVVLGKKFRISNQPLYKFRLAGAVTANGTLDNLQPDGTIELERGSVDLFSSQFFLSRSHQHKIVFSPEKGLFNPNLDIKMETVASLPPDQLRLEPTETEIREDVVTPARSDQVNITLSIKGEASQLLGVTQGESENCRTGQDSSPSLPLEGNANIFSPEELQRLETCIYAATRAVGPDSQILDAPIVTLTSTPARSEAEILALLGEQFITVATDAVTDLEQGEEAKLLEFAARRYIIKPFVRELVTDVTSGINNAVRAAGREVGLTDLRLYPSLQESRQSKNTPALSVVVEGSRQAGDNSFFNIIYDSEFNEFQLRYETRF